MVEGKVGGSLTVTDSLWLQRLFEIAKWGLENGEWGMGHGEWRMRNGEQYPKLKSYLLRAALGVG